MTTLYRTVKNKSNTFYRTVFYRPIKRPQTKPMETFDVVATRRARLRQVLMDQFGGKQTKFVEKTGINAGELSGLLRTRFFGEKKARTLEAQLGLPHLWLDGVTAKTSDKQAEWDKIVWLWEHADAEVKLMLSLLTGVMYEKKRRAFERKQRDESNAGAGKNNIGGLHDEGGEKRTDEIQTDNN